MSIIIIKKSILLQLNENMNLCCKTSKKKNNLFFMEYVS